MNEQQIGTAFQEAGFDFGRMISDSKRAPDGEECVFNANVIAPSLGKVWFGDLNLTRDAKKLKELSKTIGEPLYVLREMDARFGSETKPVAELIAKAVWTTN